MTQFKPSQPHSSPHRDFINLSSLQEDRQGPGDPGVPTNISTKYIRGTFSQQVINYVENRHRQGLLTRNNSKIDISTNESLYIHAQSLI